MSDQYPSNVTDKILQITLKTSNFAYLAIDQKGHIINQGGDFTAIGFPAWQLGENIIDSADFLSGMLPMVSNYEMLPSVHVNDCDVVDIHLFQDTDVVWIIIEDKTEDLEWQRLARQKSNELELLRHQVKMMKEQQLPLPDIALLFQALNMIGMVRQEGGAFRLLRPPAPEFSVFYPELFENEVLQYPQGRFLFIENFLEDAELLWESKEVHRRLRSGPWIDKTIDGSELALEAIALNWNDQALLIIEVLEEDYQQQHHMLQVAREGRLTEEILQREVRKATREIRDREEEVALRLVCAADSRDDGETGSHIRRLGLYSELMASHLGWEQNLIDAIRVAAPMHDIGKIGIPDSILRKPGSLTEAEFEIMKLHPEIGARILSNSRSELVQMAYQISLGHHEKWDGTGYPFGQKGEEIPISARIVAIVDVFDALIHKRVYKREMSVEQALEIMAEQRGRHFDPQLFDLFISLREEMEDIAFGFVNPIFEMDEVVDIVNQKYDADI